MTVVIRLAILLLVSILYSCSSETDNRVADQSETRSGKARLSTVAVTQAGDELRTGWYPNQPNLDPGLVAGPTFGQLFSTPINGDVHAQPLVVGNILLVATETNNIYGLNAQTGAVIWSRFLGTAYRSGDIGCADLAPNIGITATPVVDSATNVAYFFAKSYASGSSGAAVVRAHAVDVATGVDRPGFPVTISGVADNDPTLTFNPRMQLARPGLLLLDDVVYAAFGGHCDLTPYAGWVVGVSKTGSIRAMWSAISGPGRTNGAGIWQSGSGLVSDGPGRIFFTTGNMGTVRGPIPGSTPPAQLGQSVVRVNVQGDGKLLARDFFSPYDAVPLDVWDGDFGSGGPVGLPSAHFGTVEYPNLMVAQGKQGYVYLLNRDSLGGIGNATGGGDAVLGRVGPFGGMWTKAAVWPGDGGYVYLPTCSPGSTAGADVGNLLVFKYTVSGTGKPTLALAGTSVEPFGFTSSSGVVTSDGTRSGSALVWFVWSPDATGSNSQLRAYDPVPVNGVPVLRYSAPLGATPKFTLPGVGNGRIYVAARDGRVLGFGASAPLPLTGTGLDFGSVPVRSSLQRTFTVTASTTVTVNSVSITGSEFAAGISTPALPVQLSAGQSVSVPVTFAPSTEGPRSGSIVFTTNVGTQSFALSGQGQFAQAHLAILPQILSFGGTAVGSQLTQTLTLQNTGASPLAITGLQLPSAPFSVAGAPTQELVLASGGSIALAVSFTPTQTGIYTATIGIDSSEGHYNVQISGTAATPGQLVVSPLTVDAGSVPVGRSVTASFVLRNTGGSSLVITKSKPPALGQFQAVTSLPEGTTIAPNSQVTHYVRFTPNALGPTTDSWILNANDQSGEQGVVFVGIGAADLTNAGTPIALVTAPQGGGSRNLGIIKDNVFPPVNSTANNLQYDTYTTTPGAVDWVGYEFGSTQTFGALVFQEGAEFWNGGFFSNVRVQVRRQAEWFDVPNTTVSPTYPGKNGASFETFLFTFPAVTGDGIRVIGAPGGAAAFISVAELRAYSGGTITNTPPIAVAGANQTVASGAAVALDGTGSFDPNGDTLTFQWAQTNGPAVTLSSVSSAVPTFTAPVVTASTALSFRLTVSDGTQQSMATVVVTVNAAPPPAEYTDVTSSAATIIAFVTAPLGGGNKNLAILRDGVTPAPGSSNNTQQYDSWNGGGARSEDWYGYTFSSPQNFSRLRFQEGGLFWDGGFFSSIKVQVRQSGTWVDVPSASVSPAYVGANGVSFETFTFTFTPISGDAIRVYGVPGGAARFTSIAELRAFVSASSGGNQAPVANAGSNQTVAAGAAVALNGSASSDPDGTPLSYLWTQTSGPAVALSSTGVVSPTFTAPSVSTTTVLGFSLTVSDGSLSHSASVSITVNPVVQNRPPVANAGSNQTVAAGAAVALNGSASSDPDGTPLTYLWTQTSGPAVALSSTSVVSPTFTAPSVSAPTVLGFSLTVSDGSLSHSASVSITVNRLNRAPVANAGANQSVTAGAAVALSGSASSDPDGDALSYLWSQTGGPAVALSSTTAIAPTFSAPSVAAATVLGFSLTVSDGSSSHSASVAITVNPPPGEYTDVTSSAATVIAFITAPLGGGNKNLAILRDGVTPAPGSTNNTQQYDSWNGGGARSEDWYGYTFSSPQNFSRLRFQEGAQFWDGGWFSSIKVQVRQSGAWVDVTGTSVSPTYPGANGVTFETFTFTFTPISGDAIRIYGVPGGAARFTSIAELRAFVSAGASSNQAPVANAGSNQSVSSGAVVNLNGSASTDPEGAALTFQWTQTAGPTVSLSSATSATPSFAAPTVSVATDLTFTLAVSDGLLQSTASVTISVQPLPAEYQDVTNSAATIIAFVTAPLGGGSQSLSILRDGVTPAAGSTNYSQQYDSYNGGGARTEDWYGYTFSAPQNFSRLRFQEGGQFWDGGFFTSIKVQVRQSGSWVDVPSSSVSPSYLGANGVSFETFTFTFPPISGDAIRVYGAPGGAARFTSIAELRAFVSP